MQCNISLHCIYQQICLVSKSLCLLASLRQGLLSQHLLRLQLLLSADRWCDGSTFCPEMSLSFTFMHLRVKLPWDYPLTLHHHPLCFPFSSCPVVIPLPTASSMLPCLFLLFLSLLPQTPLSLSPPPLSAVESPEFQADVPGSLAVQKQPHIFSQ